jgi:hypothetical protein
VTEPKFNYAQHEPMLANVNSFPFAVAITSSGRMGAPTALREATHGPQYENTGGLVRVGGPPGTKIARISPTGRRALLVAV